ncbi:BTB/POZ domain-containing protein [Phlyctema vagabunda]|uniref:BTB/POZ domain-containing protein n=1 Tax=Phlyctema vagabunda TaxID=108571 RepID=A0ABR4PTB5_9HELO
MGDIIRKDQLEVQLKDEHQLIQSGVLKDDSPLDESEEFKKLCHACRIGDSKGCQEAIATGANINARDHYDYTPLILASLCGHYEVVQLLLESGALCERDTFQGERCLYNALNNRIRNLLLQYDYSKSTDPLQPLASHITSLLTRQTPKTFDITLTAASETWNLHKFVLSARSPYFQKKLSAAPETTVWKLASSIPAEAFQIALRYLYLGDVPSDLGISSRSFVTEEEVFKGIDKVSKQLEIESLWEGILSGSDRRIARQRHQDEVTRGRDQIETWYRNNVLKHKVLVDKSKSQDVKWNRDNGIFADVLLQADEDETVEEATGSGQATPKIRETLGPLNGIPIGPFAKSRSPSRSRKPQQSVLFPVHRAMLLRSEYFQTMFSSQFQEAQMTEYLQVIPVDCSPEVLEIVLDFLYTEKADIPLDLAIDVLFAADMLFIDKLKAKAAIVISTLGTGGGSNLVDRTHIDDDEVEVEPINVYDVIRAGWTTRVQRLEEFSARYLAYRLEDYIDEEEFEELIKESAERIQKRQETDSIELLDDIRYYLSERFRLRFEDSGLEDMMDENGEINSEAVQSLSEVPADEGFVGGGEIRTLDGEIAGDEFAADAINYQVLLGKIDTLLEKLKLDA